MKLKSSATRKGTRTGKKKPEKQAHKGRAIFLALLCVGVICFGLAGYLKLTGGGIRPPDKLSTMDPQPIDTGHADEQPAEPETPVPTVKNQNGTPSGRKEGMYTIILAGTDLDDYHTDVLMVAALDTKNGTLNVVNIPRDTQVSVKRSSKKINAAWGVGKIEQLKKELKTVIGFEPDAYAVVDLKGFVKLVNALDGVDFDVPVNMNYEDSSQNLYIHLKKGPQHLSGEEAVQLVRFRKYKEGDLKRVEVQQNFLKAVFKQTISLKNVFKIPEFAQIANDHLRSNLDVGQMAWIGQQIMKLEEDSIKFHTLPGDPSAYYKRANYFLVDRTRAIELINETINPFTVPITKDNVNISHLRDN